jgi:hypothetical protein
MARATTRMTTIHANDDAGRTEVDRLEDAGQWLAINKGVAPPAIRKRTRTTMTDAHYFKTCQPTRHELFVVSRSNKSPLPEVNKEHW